jgi:hypothetical protein
MFKLPPTSLQTFIDTPNCVLEDRVQYSTVRIPNVLCDGHLQIINCTIIISCTENFFYHIVDYVSPESKKLQSQMTGFWVLTTYNV